MAVEPGRLVLVVGPSGAGKDSVLRYAMGRFSGDDGYVFPRRLVTRAADASAEDHDSIDERSFDALAAEGEFALQWQAHGLRYGIRKDINTHLARGRIVAVNVSRTILNEVAGRYPTAVVAEVSANPAARATRLAARGRESTADASRRSRRSAPPLPAMLQSHSIDNDGDLQEAGEVFCRLLMSLRCRNSAL